MNILLGSDSYFLGVHTLLKASEFVHIMENLESRGIYYFNFQA